MSQKRSWIFILLFSLVSIPSSYRNAESCAGVDPSDISDFVLFNPGIINQPEFEPFFLSVHEFGMDEYTQAEVLNDINMYEWKEYLHFTGAEDTLSWLLYKSTIENVKTIRHNLGKSKSLADNIPTDFFKLEKNAQWKSSLDYLITAKSIEAIFIKRSYWNDTPLDTFSMDKKVQECLKKYKSTKTDFLKRRYAFQVIRLYYQQRKYADGIAWYNALRNQLGEDNISYRIRGYYAGCLYARHEYASSNLEYARLYKYDALQPMAISSFHPWADFDWNQCLSMANKEEKLTLWHLYSIYADPMQSITEMIQLDPGTDFALLPLVRIVNILEEQKLDKDFNNTYEYYESPGGEVDTLNVRSWTDYTDSYASWVKVQQSDSKEILRKLEKLSTTPGLYRKDAWESAVAYLNWMHGNYEKSKTILESTTATTGETQAQNLVTQLLNDVSLEKAASPQQEAELFKTIKEIETLTSNNINQANNAVAYALKIQSLLYPSNDARRLLCNPDPWKDITTSAIADTLLHFIQRPHHSDFENLIIARYPVNGDDLLEAMAAIKLREYDFEGARDLYKQMQNVPGLYANPFNMRISDCHECDFSYDNEKEFSYLWFVNTMIKVRDLATFSIDSTEKANNYYLFANGLYNMTWFGNARKLQETSLSWDNFYEGYYRFDSYYRDDIKDRGKNPIYNCHPALEYYQNAALYNHNKEFAAKLTWMSAKCEHNIWLEEVGDYENIDFVSGKYFAQMKNEFATTAYYKDVINECGYFCTYITGSKDCIRNKDY